MPQAVETPNVELPTRSRPRVLVVDDEPDLLELIGDLHDGGRLTGAVGIDLVRVPTIKAARRELERKAVDLLLTDVHLPDGDGVSLLPLLAAANAAARAIVMTGRPSVEKTVDALRAGAIDYLPKPFTPDALADRMGRALRRQGLDARDHRRLVRLRGAVKRLNAARHHVGKKVDLLCNDLVTAYGELARQVEVVRTEEGFRKLMAEAADLEQLLCHAMDWLLKAMGFSNIAIYLAGEEEDDANSPPFELGAYMKFTHPGEAPLTEAIRDGLLRKTVNDGPLRFGGIAPAGQSPLSKAERQHLDGQAILTESCCYLGESLAGIVLFRDAAQAYTDEDAAILSAVAPLFAVALASLVRRSAEDLGDPEDSDFGPDADGPKLSDFDSPGRGGAAEKPKGKKDKKGEADWWKRGESPPF